MGFMQAAELADLRERLAKVEQEWLNDRMSRTSSASRANHSPSALFDAKTACSFFSSQKCRREAMQWTRAARWAAALTAGSFDAPIFQRPPLRAR